MGIDVSTLKGPLLAALLALGLAGCASRLPPPSAPATTMSIDNSAHQVTQCFRAKADAQFPGRHWLIAVSGGALSINPPTLSSPQGNPLPTRLTTKGIHILSTFGGKFIGLSIDDPAVLRTEVGNRPIDYSLRLDVPTWQPSQACSSDTREASVFGFRVGGEIGQSSQSCISEAQLTATLMIDGTGIPGASTKVTVALVESQEKTEWGVKVDSASFGQKLLDKRFPSISDAIDEALVLAIVQVLGEGTGVRGYADCSTAYRQPDSEKTAVSMAAAPTTPRPETEVSGHKCLQAPYQVDFLPYEYELSSSAKQLLNQFVARVKRCSAERFGIGPYIAIAGYADEREARLRKYLGIDRAEMVKSYLIAQGLDVKNLPDTSHIHELGTRSVTLFELPLEPGTNLSPGPRTPRPGIQVTEYCPNKFEVPFLMGSQRLTSRGKEVLDSFVRRLGRCPPMGNAIFIVEGHATGADGLGQDELPLLSLNRAEVAKSYLIGQGVNPESILTKPGRDNAGQFVRVMAGTCDDVFPAVPFRPGDHKLTPLGKKKLDSFVDSLGHCLPQGGGFFDVMGYADASDNLEPHLLPYLAQKRAAFVKSYLIGKGVDANIIRDAGQGAGGPFATVEMKEFISLPCTTCAIK